MAFANPAIGGEGGELIRESIKSPNYATGVSGWSINRDGSAEFNNVNIRLDLATGSITVGPNTGPQVTITTEVDGGRINFPVNKPYSNDPNPPAIHGEGADVTEQVGLRLISGFTGSNAGTANLDLWSSEENTDTNPEVRLGAYAPGSYSELYMNENSMYADTPAFLVGNEVTTGSDKADSNQPVRISHGKVYTGAASPTTINLADTLIADAQCPNVFLEDDVAYEVKVCITLSSSAGTSAAGTQHLGWGLWQTAVGGTRLGVEMRNFKAGVGTAQGEQEFSFKFRKSGDFSGTLVLSARKIAGGDTVVATVNTRYFIQIRRIGDPAQIENM